MLYLDRTRAYRIPSVSRQVSWCQIWYLLCDYDLYEDILDPKGTTTATIHFSVENRFDRYKAQRMHGMSRSLWEYE